MIESALSAARPDVEAMTVGELRFADLKIMDNFHLRLPDAPGGAGDPQYALRDAFVVHTAGTRLRWKASAIPMVAMGLLLATGSYLLYEMAYAPYPAGIDELLAMAFGLVLAISFTVRFLRVAKRLRLSFVYNNTFDLPVEVDEEQAAAVNATVTKYGIAQPDGFDAFIDTTWLAAGRIDKACRLNQEARAGLKAAMPGKLGNLANANGASAYNPRHIAFVRLRRLSVWRAVGGLLLLLGGILLILTTIAVVNEFWGSDLGALWFWYVVIPAGFAWAWLVFGGMLGALSVIVRVASGVPFSELGLRITHPYSIEVRGVCGRWKTIADYRHQAVAIEVYNLIVRDLHQRAE